VEKDIALHQTQAMMPAYTLNVEDVKKYIAPNATDKELHFFLEVARSYGLNPFKREVYFVKYGTSPGTTICGYEMYIKRAEASGQLDGWGVELGKDELGEKAVITIHRKDHSKPFVWAVYRKEFDMGKANWASMPLFMLRKVAISQGFRLAFPSELGGMPYTPEELIDKPGITGKRSEDLSKGEYIEGEVIPEAFDAPAGMDDMPGADLEPETINLDGLARFLATVADLPELKAEFATVKADPRYAHSDKKGIKAIFDTRIAELTK
jgi:phage recombination protein Bet